MMWRDVIELVGVTTFDENEVGDQIEVPGEIRQVFANKKSIRQSEFYQAAAIGLRPEIMFEVRTIEYQEEKTLLFNGKEYSIVRAFDKNGEITEIVCSGLVNGVG
jgi:SPP1 family predicted phage head-tail adaptor